MKKPYHKNVLFVGDAAGRGIFVGPRIEGLNVGIDDGVRAANAIARALEKNNFSQGYLGEYYTKSIEESPYTKDMKEIDKEYCFSCVIEKVMGITDHYKVFARVKDLLFFAKVPKSVFDKSNLQEGQKSFICIDKKDIAFI